MASDPTRATGAKSVSKSDFIREQPITLSAAQVVDRAKARGIELRPGLVYEVRRTAKKKSPVPKAGVTAGARKASRANPTSATSKAAFVRAHAMLAPKDIVEKAKGSGMKLDVGYVYNVRGAEKAAAKRRSFPKRSLAQPLVAGSRRSSAAANTNEEEVLKMVAAEVGLGRAIEILVETRARVRAVIGT